VSGVSWGRASVRRCYDAGFQFPVLSSFRNPTTTLSVFLSPLSVYQYLEIALVGASSQQPLNQGGRNRHCHCHYL